MIETVLPGFAIISTILLFMTGFDSIRKFQANKSTGNASIVPFVSGIVNCSLWFHYGLLTQDSTQQIVNGVGLIFYLYYTKMFYSITEVKERTHRPILIAFGYIFGSILFGKMFATDLKSEIIINGYTSSLTSIAFFASPLILMSKVIETKSCDGMSFPLSVLSFVVSLCWVIYGKLVDDLFISIPNGLGLFLCVIQLLLFYLYPGSISGKLMKENIGV